MARRCLDANCFGDPCPDVTTQVINIKLVSVCYGVYRSYKDTGAARQCDVITVSPYYHLRCSSINVQQRHSINIASRYIISNVACFFIGIHDLQGNIYKIKLTGHLALLCGVVRCSPIY